MDTVKILKSARNLISDPRRWTQGDYVDRNANGEICYCAIGALAAVQEIEPGDDIPGAADLARVITGGSSDYGFWVVRYNDDHAHADILAIFDEAIEAAENGNGK